MQGAECISYDGIRLIAKPEIFRGYYFPGTFFLGTFFPRNGYQFSGTFFPVTQHFFSVHFFLGTFEFLYFLIDEIAEELNSSGEINSSEEELEEGPLGITPLMN